MAKIGNWIFNLRTNKVIWSEELYGMFEIEKSDFDGRHESFVSRVHPDDQSRVLQTNAQTRIEGPPFEIEYRIITPNEQVKKIREVGYANLDEAGHVNRIFGTAQDVTERQQSEDALRQSEDRLRLVIDTIPIMAWSVHPDGAVDFVNQLWLDYTGLTWEQYVQEPNGMIHPEDKTDPIALPIDSNDQGPESRQSL